MNYAESCTEAAEVVAGIKIRGGHAIALRADVSDVGACAALIRDTIDVLGGLDIVVNNAGIVRDGLICRMSDADWNAVIATDLTGVFNVTRAAGQYLIRQHSGVIVNVASVSGMVGNVGQANYSA